MFNQAGQAPCAASKNQPNGTAIKKTVQNRRYLISAAELKNKESCPGEKKTDRELKKE